MECVGGEKSIFVGFGLNVSRVDIVEMKGDEGFMGKEKKEVGK